MFWQSLEHVWNRHTAFTLSLALYFHFFDTVSVQMTPVFYTGFSWFYHAGRNVNVSAVRLLTV